jgi:hypothetical protein
VSGRSKANVEPCGSVAAYRRHRAHGEPTCQACRDAVAAERRLNASRKLRIAKPPGRLAANAARAEMYAERLEEYAWLRDGRVDVEEAAARVGVKAAPNVRAYEAWYQEQRTRQREAVA